VDGTAATLSSTFDGSGLPLTGPVTTATGLATFATEVGSAHGIRWVRKGSREAGYRSAHVVVNGKVIRTWLEPLGNKHSKWLTDAYGVS
jgi:hypothetical protein